ncbi:hypothetical protein AADZ86_06150 [Colwelliaceae bacterium BS250]
MKKQVVSIKSSNKPIQAGIYKNALRQVFKQPLCNGQLFLATVLYSSHERFSEMVNI